MSGLKGGLYHFRIEYISWHIHVQMPYFCSLKLFNVTKSYYFNCSFFIYQYFFHKNRLPLFWLFRPLILKDHWKNMLFSLCSVWNWYKSIHKYISRLSVQLQSIIEKKWRNFTWLFKLPSTNYSGIVLPLVMKFPKYRAGYLSLKSCDWLPL